MVVHAAMASPFLLLRYFVVRVLFPPLLHLKFLRQIIVLPLSPSHTQKDLASSFANFIPTLFLLLAQLWWLWCIDPENSNSYPKLCYFRRKETSMQWIWKMVSMLKVLQHFKEPVQRSLTMPVPHNITHLFQNDSTCTWMDIAVSKARFLSRFGKECRCLKTKFGHWDMGFFVWFWYLVALCSLLEIRKAFIVGVVLLLG